MKKSPQYPQGEAIFRETPLDEFIRKHIKQLPKDMPKKVKEKLLHDAKFLAEHGIKTDRPERALEGISSEIVSKAYPNFDQYMFIQPERDTKKWIQSVQDLFSQIHNGKSREEALANITSGWEKMEKQDFENWLRFYQADEHQKYKAGQVQKMAQANPGMINYWEDANRAGYFVPIIPERQMPQAQRPVLQEINNTVDINAAEAAAQANMAAAEKRNLIEMQRNKIIGRLDSAEKLIRSPEGQQFAGPEFETLLEIVYQLKKKIHMVNKLSVSTRLYSDMIVREANILSKKGFIKAASFLHSVAQDMPAPAEAKNPLDNSGIPGNLPGEGPGLQPPGLGPMGAGNAPPSAPADPTTESGPPPAPPGIAAGKNTGLPGGAIEAAPAPLSEGMREFLDGLDFGNDTFDNEDELEVHDDELLATAQAIPTARTDAPPRDAPDNIEMNEDQADPGNAPSKDFDSLLDTAFSGLTVYDVVSKLEEVAKIFKVREIPRQLAFIDLMLNQLGLASLFPTLAEAINKSLDSNQYISTRIDDILSQLRGTLKTKDIDLTGQEQEQSPEAQQVKQKLTQENDQAKARKQMRKDLENQELAGVNKISPEIDVAQEMAEGELPTPAPASQAPPLPTAAPAAPR